MTYSEKLKDPRWQKKRLEIMQRDNFTCQICGDKESTLHVHHYDYMGDPWEIENRCLKTLCENCHEYEHKHIEQTRIDLIDVSKFLTTDSITVLSILILEITKTDIDINKLFNHLRLNIKNNKYYYNGHLRTVEKIIKIRDK
jgi:hypothetical protein